MLSCTLVAIIISLPLLTLVELWQLSVALFVPVLCAISFIDEKLLPVETSIELFGPLCCLLGHSGNVFLPIKTSSEVPASDHRGDVSDVVLFLQLVVDVQYEVDEL